MCEINERERKKIIGERKERKKKKKKLKLKRTNNFVIY